MRSISILLTLTLMTSTASAGPVFESTDQWLSRNARVQSIYQKGLLVMLGGTATLITGIVIGAAGDLPDARVLNYGTQLAAIDEQLASLDAVESLKNRALYAENLKEQKRTLINELLKHDVDVARPATPDTIARLRERFAEAANKRRQYVKRGVAVMGAGAILTFAGVAMFIFPDTIADQLITLDLADAGAQDRLAAMGLDRDEVVSQALIAYARQAALLQ